MIVGLDIVVLLAKNLAISGKILFITINFNNNLYHYCVKIVDFYYKCYIISVQGSTNEEPGMAVCDKCIEGFYHNASSNDCIPCPFGFTSEYDKNICTLCLGEYPCASDMMEIFSIYGGASGVPGPKGDKGDTGTCSSCDFDDVARKPCPPGNGRRRSDNYKQCSPCLSGFYNDGTYKHCKACDTGSYPNSDATSCIVSNLRK
jgi:hypothetical protein